MKEIDEMTKQEVIDEMNNLEDEAERSGGFMDSVDGERWEDLSYAKTHNFPRMIGGKDDDYVPLIDHD
jgi:hypothetical protein